MSGPASKANFRQNVQVEVIRASPLIGKFDYLKTGQKCEKCGNIRRWLIRCEYCGSNEQTLSVEE